jgi:hypothetical protein
MAVPIVRYEGGPLRVSRLDDLAGVVLVLVYPRSAEPVEPEMLRGELARALADVPRGSTVVIDVGTIDVRHLGATAVLHDLDRLARRRGLDVRWRLGETRLTNR